MNIPTHDSQPHGKPVAAPPAASSVRRLPATSEEWEQLRRSVAMLSPGAWALKREPALAALDLLLDHLRNRP
ncbi:MAG: hypothetical protein OEY41_00460 [Acidimicrobiia bacterium]|nr:hypothetical protein [Acidimicrobiia bacterium]MDH4362570.1 hypothetical protein [Acidimicrobiia bacterium]MDH5288450.1 hypothetical protein [Acidimicrobiia bacterium]